MAKEQHEKERPLSSHPATKWCNFETFTISRKHFPRLFGEKFNGRMKCYGTRRFFVLELPLTQCTLYTLDTPPNLDGFFMFQQ